LGFLGGIRKGTRGIWGERFRVSFEGVYKNISLDKDKFYDTQCIKYKKIMYLCIRKKSISNH